MLRSRKSQPKEPDLATQRKVVDAFLAASRDGDFDALVALLDPDVVLRADRGAVPAGAWREVRGAEAVAGQALNYSQLALLVRPALVNGAASLVGREDRSCIRRECHSTAVIEGLEFSNERSPPRAVSVCQAPQHARARPGPSALAIWRPSGSTGSP